MLTRGKRVKTRSRAEAERYRGRLLRPRARRLRSDGGGEMKVGVVSRFVFFLLLWPDEDTSWSVANASHLVPNT